MSFPVDPEYHFLTTFPPTPPITKDNLAGFRNLLPTFFPKAAELVEGVKEQHFTFPGPDNVGENDVYVYSPEKSSETKLPVLFWIHGGGNIAGDAAMDKYSSTNFVSKLGIVVISANYRLAPEHAYPAASDDLYNALKWVHNNSEKLGIDVNRIAVGGASAGGGLAAALALRVRDKREYNFVFQFLKYPMLDDRTCLRQHNSEIGKYIWTLENNKFGWQSYLGEVPIGDENVSEYAAPSRAKSLSNLPPAFIAIGNMDLFRDENVDYAQRLWKAGVSAELVVYPGICHGFDTLTTSQVAQNFNNRSFEVLQRVLFPSKH